MRFLYYQLLVAALVVSVALARTPSRKPNVGIRKLPDGLRLGVATAAYQVEGAWNAADKSPSIWDTFSHIPGKIIDGTNGDDTCMSYEYYKRDIEMLKFLGVDFYRFSISWPRVLPTGFANKISKDGIAYYSNLVDELLANGIEPVVTMYHWDLPQSLQDLGGWINPLIVDWFEDYVRVLFDTLGDRVKTWITINEPKQFTIYGYGMEMCAPNIVSPGIGDYIAVKNVLLAHARAWHLYDKEYREKQKGICGITIAADFAEGATNSSKDIEAGNIALDFEIGFYSHPIFSATGGFPERMVKRVAEKSAEQGFPRSRLPELSQDEIEYIRGTSDFFGFNHYSTRFYTENSYKSGMFDIPSYADDIGAGSDYGAYDLAPVPHTTKIPTGIRKALNWVKDTYNNPQIMIFENGYGTLGGIDDNDRVQYLKEYIDAVLDAIEVDGCNISRYTIWSLMDNFEWFNGLRYLFSTCAKWRNGTGSLNYQFVFNAIIPNEINARFGIFEVDFEDEKKTRRARLSALWFKNLIANRTLNSNDETILEDIRF